ncbi:thiopeptide-type bacteriocin biosynthesis protein [Mesobacillus subterraneus]|uniref:thiopeptide-type bacteriocin biosynthesis protein n=1 Tax=Mesobacillus subterraneus TaxID=285983 RepID=UPI001CFE2F64|nr:thiopeptide-type bacteriocin biosynthesis protein [Mesobacillus subterraneus]WLR54582.1 thiopeptide-type bacteriocin biosynthesis protein [Mesobacillus subterraneus]
MKNYEWLQYNIYSKDIHELDYLVSFIVKPAAYKVKTMFDVSNWFFIRYLDETGPHIRLRFQISENEFSDVMGCLEEFLSTSLESLNEQSIAIPKRLLPLNMGEGLFSSAARRFELSLYDPELEKYGGEEGILHSEKHFSSSSNLILEVIEDIITERVNRFEFAIKLMDNLMKAAWENQNEIDEFLLNYTKYWAGDKLKNGDNQISQNFINSAMSRNEKVKEILVSEFPPNTERALEQFTDELKLILQEMNPLGESGPDGIYFHFTHMMNNRLGVWPIEESYLAALLYSAGKTTVTN